jgi:hypothetical protein
MTEETWVNIVEAAESTGYNRNYIQKLVKKLSKQPEEEREIRLRLRTSYWEVWLPDLVQYISTNSMRGPRKKRKSRETTSS